MEQELRDNVEVVINNSVALFSIPGSCTLDLSEGDARATIWSMFWGVAFRQRTLLMEHFL